ncbi:MAG: hypothetical protein U9N87_10130 [Planctomycetota bacterium]|nr:hypothetical protein [Planctomycetota bacterium]
MNELLNTIISQPPLADASLWLGRAAFIAVYVLLAVGLMLMPAKILGEAEGRPWWKSLRTWAMAIIVVQIGVYWYWG